MNQQREWAIGVDEQVFAVPSHFRDRRAHELLQLRARRLATHVQALRRIPDAEDLRADDRRHRSANGLDLRKLGHVSSPPYRTGSAAASCPNSEMSSVSPRRMPSIFVVASAPSISSTGHTAWSALRSVLRRWPN